MAPRARFVLATLRLTAEAVEILNALSCVAYRETRPIFRVKRREKTMKDGFCVSGSSPGKPGNSTHEDPATSSGSSPGKSDSPDFICQRHGSIFLLIPRSAAAKAWVDEHLPEDRMTFGDGIVVEPRYIWTIILAIQDAGMVVSR